MNLLLNDKLNFPELEGIRCAAHTIQLAIKNAFQDVVEIADFKTKMERIVKYLKKSNVGGKILNI